MYSIITFPYNKQKLSLILIAYLSNCFEQEASAAPQTFAPRPGLIHSRCAAPQGGAPCRPSLHLDHLPIPTANASDTSYATGVLLR